MQILTTRNDWQNGYLDYHLDPERQVRVDVTIWIRLAQIDDQYIIRERDWQLVWNYLRKIGIRAVANKIISRTSELERNAKFASIGIGRVTSGGQGNIQNNDWVLFFAYNHPACVSRLVVEKEFVVPWLYPVEDFDARTIQFFSDDNLLNIPQALSRFFGWSPYAGVPVAEKETGTILQNLAEQIHSFLQQKKNPPNLLLTKDTSPFQERTVYTPSGNNSKSVCRAVVFGLGNYAKTSILPNLHTGIEVDCIHEIDPMQLGSNGKYRATLDTAGFPRDDESYDVYFVAGFHHTHANIAITALDQGAYAVVEKPIVTSREQLQQLTQSANNLSKSQLFACFHKRYLDFNKWIKHDLQHHPGLPIDYHCIVYEIPLPQRHWYNWPNSCSRITSNGCHWIDHFLFLNDYAQVIEIDLRQAKNGSLLISLELINGAVFSMTLTDVGSSRLGVRDYVEVHAKGVTIRMIDGARYESENGRQILRCHKINPMHSYQRMYREISQRIIEGQAGDDMITLYSSEIMVTLEERLQEQLLRHPA